MLQGIRAKFDYNGSKRGVSTNVPIEIVVNGEPRTAPEGQTILGLLRELRPGPRARGGGIDRRIVKQGQWPETVLRTGARLEIVQFVGGG